AKYPAHDSKKAAVSCNGMHVAHLLHHVRHKNVAGSGGQHNQQNRSPRIERCHDLFPVPTASGVLWPGASVVSVRAGPWVTNPTPEEISRMPIHRVALISS